jgi:hypothetical protein
MASTTQQDTIKSSDEEYELFQSPCYVTSSYLTPAQGNNFQDQHGRGPSQYAQLALDSILSNSSDTPEQDGIPFLQRSSTFHIAPTGPHQILEPSSQMGHLDNNSQPISSSDSNQTGFFRSNGDTNSVGDMNGLSSSHNEPSNTMPAIDPIIASKAHNMKVQLGAAPHIPLVSSRKRVLPEHDPENHEIKRLRCDEKMSWGSIAEHMNKYRIERGKSPIFTEAAVYSRYVRSGPRIARIIGEEFSSQGHKNLRDGPNFRRVKRVSSTANFPPHHDEMLVEAYEEAQAAFWETVAELLAKKSGKMYSKTDCAMRFNQL